VLGLALAVIAIALPDSLNPSLIVAAVYLTTGPHPVRRTIAFTIAAFVVTLAGGLVIALGIGDVILSALPRLSDDAKWWLVTAFGVALVSGGVVIWWRRESLANSEPPSEPPSGGGGSAAIMGAGIAGVELLTAFPYFAAIALVAGSSAPLAGKAFLIVLYDVIYVLPLIVIVVICAVMGERGRRLLTPIGDWIAMRWPVVVAPCAGVAGAGLAVYGIAQVV
jgi:cytochrome c biogenesis protein CcdA